MKAPPSLMKMSGSEERQEGNYASSDLPKAGRILLQNDLGLTLLPGSQIEKRGENSPVKTTESEKCQVTETHKCTNICIGDSESQRLKDLTRVPLGGIDSGRTALSRCNEDINQTLLWIEGKGEDINSNQSRQQTSQQRRSSLQEILTRIGDGRLRYCQRVRGCKDAPEENRPPKRSRIGTLLAENAIRGQFISKVSPPSDDSSIHIQECNTVESPRSERQAQYNPSPNSISRSVQRPSSLLSTPVARCLQSSTSFYPRRRKQRYSPVKNSNPHNHPFPQPPTSTDGQSLMVQQLVSAMPDSAAQKWQAELKGIRNELFEKTKAESDAQRVVYQLSKAYDALMDTADAHLELQKVHNSLLSEHRRLLKSYECLAKAHASCRSTSSRKLAQRIIDAAPLPKEAAYPSSSPSIAAPSSWLDLRAHVNATVQSSYSATPLIDLTRSPSLAQAPVLQSSSVVSVPFKGQGDQSTTGDDSNYANINGFDDEANEMFNDLWESEIVQYGTGDDRVEEV